MASEEDSAVVVPQSANPEFFSAHADFEWSFDPSTLIALTDPEADPAPNPLQQLNERLRTLPQVTLAKLRGYARAGGVELAMAADMRFAAADLTWLSQPESLMGIFPAEAAPSTSTGWSAGPAPWRSCWGSNRSTPPAAKEALGVAEASGPVPQLKEEAAAHAKVYPSPDDPPRLTSKTSCSRHLMRECTACGSRPIQDLPFE
ncbi:enoyl-CoA hydratase/isomerase family protein [Streptomyces tubbatahanensis]|uniref:Enoyl-CoA hydratase/isomerase family protein n=1 Tax=Streptomyces tubbatahanensis TaxID=2923272 RepID=A0ABY3Y102_9ACTN|nr:enoyl-CoA hydratase/isomerase family protein [Streptomyces tubbatahanensis]UNT00297.1 enoyl-CoA hydratase/isomerase family protein [Streptomyces tubbatahanensis]